MTNINKSKGLVMINKDEVPAHCGNVELKIDQLTSDISDVKKDVKSINLTLSKLAVIEERQTSMLKMSETNSKSIDELWSRVDSLRSKNHELGLQLAKTNGAETVMSAVVWKIVAGVMAAIGIILTAIMSYIVAASTL